MLVNAILFQITLKKVGLCLYLFGLSQKKAVKNKKSHPKAAFYLFEYQSIKRSLFLFP